MTEALGRLSRALWEPGPGCVRSEPRQAGVPAVWMLVGSGHCPQGAGKAGQGSERFRPIGAGCPVLDAAPPQTHSAILSGTSWTFPPLLDDFLSFEY